jgi:hypothetical protein
MAELSAAFSAPSLKLRRALLAIHPHGKPWGFLAKESKATGGVILAKNYLNPARRVNLKVSAVLKYRFRVSGVRKKQQPACHEFPLAC